MKKYRYIFILFVLGLLITPFSINAAGIYSFNSNLSIGSRGSGVVALQNTLIQKGFSLGLVDGSFGPKTKQAVILFQITKGLTPDGYVGPKTRNILNNDNLSIITVAPNKQNSVNLLPVAPIIVNSNLTADCNQNKFNAAFVLVSPDPSDQKTNEFLTFLEDLKGKFEQAFKGATYDLATMNVEDIFITKTGSEDYINNPSQINLQNVTKDLISKNGDKYNFVYVFTTYDPQTNSQYFAQVKNIIKNIGFSTFDNSKYYGSSGKLLGVSLNGDFLSRYKSMLNRPDMLSRQLPTDAPFGISDLIHETGHQWCCHLGDKFSGNGDKSKIEIIGLDGSHYYTGLESPAKTRDVLSSLPWVLDENSGTYFLEKLTTINDFGFSHYPIRYHPITLYAMGLLSKDQYSKEFKIFDTDEKQGSMKDADVEIYSKTSVNDIIKIFGERTCSQ
ncbi:MAG: NLP/P60 protein [Candidatus Nomurabacteria bacterium GW2011_GWB1_37_5]|uniref:NLP/P60 protein n=1 Tax=Candidatus Nomurabacteria bacterium GW2011_GWB1_37_5 TaxID=1618742 RepID=A0A0G0K2N2_9BACT|nr:MAG: NLP/P60 protein [Candidatus Nomurabacteria bacterium GW2011_GWB1_37_5]